MNFLQDEPNDDHDEFIRFLGQHFVSLGWQDASPGFITRESPIGAGQNTSGFVVSVGGVWLLITAGHVIQKIEQARRNRQKMGIWQLDDSWSHNTAFAQAIPFDYVGARKWWWTDPESDVQSEDVAGLDYGAIEIRDFYRPALLRNGITPLDEMGWYHDLPQSFDGMMMLGMPTALSGPLKAEGWQRKGCVRIPMRPVTEIPVHLKSKFPRLYGFIGRDLRNPRGERLSDIDGMSGCPIFGFKKTADGRNRYWALGIQSGWDKNNGIVYACPLQRFAQYIGMLLQENHPGHPSDRNAGDE